jgi:Flp pilus assembly CpaF family ATPase
MGSVFENNQVEDANHGSNNNNNNDNNNDIVINKLFYTFGRPIDSTTPAAALQDPLSALRLRTSAK